MWYQLGSAEDLVVLGIVWEEGIKEGALMHQDRRGPIRTTLTPIESWIPSDLP